MSLASRLTAACVCDWFRTTVVPRWQEHAISMHPSPTQLERDVFLQAGKGTEGRGEEITDLVEHSAESDLLDEDNQLFYSAKITYKTPYPSAADQSEPPWPHPCFIGSDTTCALLMQHLRPMAFKSPVPIVQEVQRNELANHTAGRRHIMHTLKRKAKKDTPMRLALFKNALERNSSEGYRYQSGSSCISVFSRFRLVVYEQYERDSTALEHSGISGGINFIFINPRFSVKAIKLLYVILRESDTAFYNNDMMQRFCQLLTVFMCPSIPMKISLIFDVRDPFEVEKYIAIFQGDCRKDVTAGGEFEECVYHQTTSPQGNHTRVKSIKYASEHYSIRHLSTHPREEETAAAELPVIMTSPHEYYDNGQNKIFSWYLQTQRDVSSFQGTS